MKKAMLGMTLGLSVSVLSTSALSAEKVNIGAPSWTGAQAIAALLQAVVVERIGGEANLVPGNNATILKEISTSIPMSGCRTRKASPKNMSMRRKQSP